MSQLVFICGSALRGQPAHDSLAGATFVRTVQTQALYRLHSVAGLHPGIYTVATGGIAIPGELYEMSDVQYQHLLDCEPPHLYPEEIVLADGTPAIAMLYPQAVIEEQQYPDISSYGGWAAYKAQAAD